VVGGQCSHERVLRLRTARRRQLATRLRRLPTVAAFGRALAAELAHVEFVIRAVRRHQAVMCTALDDLAGLEYEHLVGVPDRAQPMSDDETGPIAQQALQRALDQSLGARVDAGGRFVQDQDARIGQRSAGDRQQLPLSLTQPGAALAQFRLISLRQTLDEGMGIGQLGGGDDLLVAWRPAGRSGCSPSPYR